MRRIVVLGEGARTRGYRLAGATVIEAEDGPAVELAWRTLPADTAVLVLTRAAAARLADRLAERPRLPSAVIPE